MIPLLYLLPIPHNNGWGLGAMATCPMCGLPVGILIAGFKDKEELPDVANYVYKQIMAIYENWNKVINEPSIPKDFLEAWNDEREEG